MEIKEIYDGFGEKKPKLIKAKFKISPHDPDCFDYDPKGDLEMEVPPGAFHIYPGDGLDYFFSKEALFFQLCKPHYDGFIIRDSSIISDGEYFGGQNYGHPDLSQFLIEAYNWNRYGSEKSPLDTYMSCFYAVGSKTIWFFKDICPPSQVTESCLHQKGLCSIWWSAPDWYEVKRNNLVITVTKDKEAAWLGYTALLLSEYEGVPSEYKPI